MAQTDERVEFERLLEFVRVERNFDFTGYKRSSVTRRTDKRMRESASRAMRTTSTTWRRTPRSSPASSTRS